VTARHSADPVTRQRHTDNLTKAIFRVGKAAASTATNQRNGVLLLAKFSLSSAAYAKRELEPAAPTATTARAAARRVPAPCVAMPVAMAQALT